MAANTKSIIFKSTEAGKQSALQASGDDTKILIDLTHVAVGKSKYTPTGGETSLKNEVGRSDIVSGEVVDNTLRFTSTMYADDITPVYEMGIFTKTGVLFAVAASSTDPLVTLYPNIAFVTAFGVAIDDMDADSITVSTDPNASLATALMQNHVAATDPHPQYVALSRFQLLLDVMFPVGYLHHTNSATNPKPEFDQLLGIDTAWRRLAGKIIVGTDPSDDYIKDVGLVLGQKGMTTPATNNERPNVYPLYTKNIFERYNPDNVIETIWNVSANKTSVNEGDAVRFTVTANNIPDGQILNWTVKEGELNSGSNDITAPDKSQSGTVILKNGSALIDFTTTPDDNAEEPQKHVRLTVGAPASLSINVPINDLGNTESIVHITQSTTNGMQLDEYYKQQSGSYPTATDKIRFIVDAGVDIIAPDTDTPAVEDGVNWPSGSQIVVENHGRILGRGGDAGRSARSIEDNESPLPINTYGNYAGRERRLIPAVAGGDGGTAIKGKITVENHGLIASGGGGGGGSSGFMVNKSATLPPYGNTDYKYQFMFYGVVEAGVGGGAPFGSATYNYTGVKAFNERHNIDISDYYPALGVNDVVMSASVAANLWQGAPNYPNSDPIVKEDGTYAVRIDWRDGTVQTPSGGHVPSDDHIDHVVRKPWGSVSNEQAYRADFFDKINLPLPDMGGDDYSLFNDIAGYRNRSENVTLAEMKRQGEFMMSYEAKDGDLLTGGRGGANVWDSPFETQMYTDNYQLSDSKKWRFTRAITKKPASRAQLNEWYGSGATDNGSNFYNDTYTTELDFYNDVKGGNGGDVGESGQAGSVIPEYVVIATADTSGYNELRIAKADTAELSVFRTPAAQGGLAGFIKEGEVTITNYSAGTTKGR